jgi:hypothetical protein
MYKVKIDEHELNLRNVDIIILILIQFTIEYPYKISPGKAMIFKQQILHEKYIISYTF